MTRHVPAQQPHTRVIHYAEPTPSPAEVLLALGRDVQRRQKEDRLLYARWLRRQAALAERDRLVRRRLWIAAAVVVPLFAGVGVWLAIQLVTALAAVGSTLLGLLLAVALVTGCVAVGHRCCHIVVQHWHR